MFLAQKLVLLLAGSLTNALVLPNICKNKGQSSLTFDMGPIVGTTDKILDVLKAKNVKATFHLTPTLLVGATDVQNIVSRIAMEGHLLGFSFDQTAKYMTMSNEQLIDYVGKSVAIIQRYGGKTPKFIRLLYETYDDRIIQALVNNGYYATSFIDTYDYLYPNDVNGLISYLNITYKPGSLVGSQRIFKFMDTNQTAQALPYFIDSLIASKVQLATLDSCLNESPYFTGKLDGSFEYNNGNGDNVVLNDPSKNKGPGSGGVGVVVSTTSSAGDINYSGLIILVSTLFAIAFQWI